MVGTNQQDSKTVWLKPFKLNPILHVEVFFEAAETLYLVLRVSEEMTAKSISDEMI